MTASPMDPAPRATPSPVTPTPGTPGEGGSPEEGVPAFTKRGDPARYRYAHYKTVRAGERRREQRNREQRREKNRRYREARRLARESGEPMPGDTMTLNALPAESYFLATEGHSDRVDTQVSLLSALSALPQRERDVIFRRHWLGESWSEVSNDLSLSPRTLRDAENSGLSKLRSALTESDFR